MYIEPIAYGFLANVATSYQKSRTAHELETRNSECSPPFSVP